MVVHFQFSYHDQDVDTHVDEHDGDNVNHGHNGNAKGVIDWHVDIDVGHIRDVDDDLSDDFGHNHVYLILSNIDFDRLDIDVDLLLGVEAAIEDNVANLVGGLPSTVSVILGPGSLVAGVDVTVPHTVERSDWGRVPTIRGTAEP